MVQPKATAVSDAQARGCDTEPCKPSRPGYTPSLTTAATRQLAVNDPPAAYPTLWSQRARRSDTLGARGAQIGDRGKPVDRHQEVQFGEQSA
jgi:hypothetical protein